jgi:hypothetical protein
LDDRGIILNREVQIRRGRKGEMPGQNTDIHVVAITPKGGGVDRDGAITLIIEVKGSWNAGVMTDMKDQLRDRYLRNNNCRVRLYVVANFRADRP